MQLTNTNNNNNNIAFPTRTLRAFSEGSTLNTNSIESNLGTGTNGLGNNGGLSTGVEKKQLKSNRLHGKSAIISMKGKGQYNANSAPQVRCEVNFNINTPNPIRFIYPSFIVHPHPSINRLNNETTILFSHFWSIQRMAIKTFEKHIIQAVRLASFTHLPSSPILIADYGSSEGYNSLSPIKWVETIK